MFGDDCLKLVPRKTNVLLWGDSLAAHYFHGLSKATDPQATNVLQSTQAACMPTFNASAQFLASCRNAASQMQAFFRDNKPDLVILSGDWLEYGRPPRFEGMIADLCKTIADINGRGIRVVLLDPPVQFKGRLLPMRLHLRGAEARADDLLLPGVFTLDAKMRAALPPGERFAYVSVLKCHVPCTAMSGHAR
jgi:SGNH domain-containing protein